jgi:methylmalonyl-CoA/ethylmalonyl-CoA epimerase
MLLHQVAVHADDLDRAVAFYRDVFGLPFLARFDPPGLAFFDLGGGTRLLLEHGAPSSLLYVGVDDIAAEHTRLRGAGVAFEGEPHLIHTHDGTMAAAGVEEWMAFLRDSEGNLVGLSERRVPASP